MRYHRLKIDKDKAVDVQSRHEKGDAWEALRNGTYVGKTPWPWEA